MEPTREQIHAWLTSVVQRTGATPTELARRAGLAQSTLTRFLNNPDAPMLGLRSIAKVAAAAGVEPPAIREPSAGSVAIATPRGMAESDGVPFAQPVEHERPRLREMVEAALGGRTAANAWVLKTDALKFAGYLPGDIVVVDLSLTPRAGQVVCAQVYRWQQAKADTVFRIYEPPYLVAVTDGVANRRPLIVDNDQVVVKGVVTEAIRLA